MKGYSQKKTLWNIPLEVPAKNYAAFHVSEKKTTQSIIQRVVNNSKSEFLFSKSLLFSSSNDSRVLSRIFHNKYP